VTNAVHRRPGRPPGATNTRDLVLAAARRAFTEKGYDAASLRQIAGDGERDKPWEAAIHRGAVRPSAAQGCGPCQIPDRPHSYRACISCVVRGVSPLIWRRLLIPADTTIAGLHAVLQIAFGWNGDHLGTRA